MFLENKYTKWYYAIIEIAKNRQPLGYVEKHHIVPKSMGGSNVADNLVKLTAREHFICHRLLTKMTIELAKKKMVFAVWAFVRKSGSQQRQTINSRTYQTIRSEWAVTMSAENKGKLNVGRKASPEERLKISEAGKGKPKSEQTKQRMREAWKNRPKRSEEHCNALSKALKGKTHTEETKKRMSLAKKGKPATRAVYSFECEHCSKIGVGQGNYNRWHGNNCKEKVNG